MGKDKYGLGLVLFDPSYTPPVVLYHLSSNFRRTPPNHITGVRGAGHNDVPACPVFPMSRPSSMYMLSCFVRVWAQSQMACGVHGLSHLLLRKSGWNWKLNIAILVEQAS